VLSRLVVYAASRTSPDKIIMPDQKLSEQEKIVIGLHRYLKEEIERLMAKGHYGKLIIEFQAGNIPRVRSEEVKSAREIVRQYCP